jgi:hypothetical protein
MAAQDHPTPATALPDDLRGLTYGQATPEQVAQTREHMRAQLAAAYGQRSPEERQRRHAAFLDRLNAA